MGGIFQHLHEPTRPPEGQNNIWYEPRDTDRVIVFVHGVLSDSQSCWYRPGPTGQPGVYWPDMLVKDPEFNKYSIYLGGYYTKSTAREYGVSDCSEELFGALGRKDNGNRPVLDHDVIVFVCHSTGGIVVRYLLEVHTQAFAGKTIGLALVASPSYGSDWASTKLLRMLGKVYRHAIADELRWAGPVLRDLDDRFRMLLDEERIPRIKGIEACENHFIFRRRYLPPLPRVVTKESAGRYFGRTTVLPDTDHFTSVKPDSHSHPAYTLLRDFRARFERKFLEAPQMLSIPNVKHAPAGNYACRAVQWDADIDEEGDACNELSFLGLSLLEKRQENWIELPKAVNQSGQLNPYDLVDSDGSQGITLEPSPEGARAIKLRVRFANRPTAQHPASFCLRNYDLNAYSMNTEEFRTKPNFREDGIDYAEKIVDEHVEFLTLTVRLPQEMKLARPPYFEVYEYDGGEPHLHDGLTSALQPHFRYSKLLRTAILQVPRPAAPYVYRIAWQIANTEVIQPPGNIALARYRASMFASRALEARGVLIGQTCGGPAADFIKVIATTMTSFAEYVSKLVVEKLGASARLDPKTLSVSLMVLDSGRRQLVIVAGIGVTDPAFTLSIGDGNAGRAWKRRAARVYDKRVVSPKSNVYFPNPARPQHEILYSLPLVDPESESVVHGIVNLGTRNEAQAELLRALKDRESIEKLIAYCASYVLQRLLIAIES